MATVDSRITPTAPCLAAADAGWSGRLALAGFVLVVAGVLVGLLGTHTAVAQDDPAVVADSDTPGVLAHVRVPARLASWGEEPGERLRAALPDTAGAVLFDFSAGAALDLHDATVLAEAIFAEQDRRTIALVNGPITDAALMPVTACHEIWMRPGARLGPFSMQHPDRAEQIAIFRSYLRSTGDDRAARHAMWETWTHPETPLYTRPGGGFANEPVDGGRRVDSGGLLILVTDDAAARDVAQPVRTDLAAFASARGYNLQPVAVTPGETVRPDTPDTAGTAAEGPAPRPAIPTTPQLGARIPITGPIDDGLAWHIATRAQEAIDAGATVLVFEMDTPGGMVSSMIDIVKTMGGIRDKGVVSVAWIESDAISAGAAIALACDYIAMRDGTRIGDCQPIMMTGSGYSVGGEKIQTYLRSLMRGQAERNGYPLALVEAMITQEIEVIRLEPRTGQDRQLMLDTFGSDFATRRDFEGWKHKDRFTVAEIVVHGSTGQPAPAPTVNGQPAPGAPMTATMEDGELLTMTDRQARAWGFALPDVSTWAQLEQTFRIGTEHGSGPVEEHAITWSVDFVRWINSIAGILIMIGLVGIYIEFKTPGFGVGGIIALTAFGLYFGSGLFIGLAESWEILVFLAGILLIAAEIFVIPGFGIAGMLGLILTFLGLLLAGQEFVVPETAYQSDVFVRNVGGLLLGLFGAFIGMAVLARFLPSVPVFNRLLLKPPGTGTARRLHAAAAALETGTLLGAIGVATSVLKPSGKARFGDRLVDVQTKGDYVNSGAEVVVTEARGNRIVVKPVTPVH